MTTLGGRQGHSMMAANICVIYSTLDLYNALATGNVSPQYSCTYAAKNNVRPSLELDTHLIDIVKFS